ncbi:glycosyltransferase family 4 protein [Candidatus Omnitrophota bacterium]
MKICYFPGRERSYSRTRVFIMAMRSAGIDCLDCSSDDKGFMRYIFGFFKFLSNKGRSDLICVGFLGYFIIFAVKLFTGKKVILDAFVSIHRTMVEDRQKIRPGGLLAKTAKFIDKTACKLADKVFVDTEQDIIYFTENYGLSRDHFCRLYASADDSVMYPRGAQEGEGFSVEFHGEFQKLHGVKYIVEAAALLPDVRFNLIGGGIEHGFCMKRARELNLQNISFKPWVEYARIPEYMSRASVCLGIFGDTPKTNMVIPIKVYEALAMKKPVITADTPAARELLADGESAILCGAGNPEMLAEAIVRLKKDPALRDKIAENGHQLFKEKCSPSAIGKKILAVAQGVL